MKPSNYNFFFFLAIDISIYKNSSTTLVYKCEKIKKKKKKKKSTYLHLQVEYYMIADHLISSTRLCLTFTGSPPFILNVKDNKCSGTLSLLSTSIPNLSSTDAAMDFI